jgi:predicted RNA-binding Zn ribbon-like protein
MPERAIAPGTPIAELALVGGHRCLDFINTLVGADETSPKDSLLTPADYRTWAKRVAIPVDPPAAAAAEAAALRRARALREAFLAVASAAVAGRPSPADAAEHLTDAAARSFRSRRLTPRPGGLGWTRTRQDLDSVTDLLAVEAAALFGDCASLPLRRCVGKDCGWFFLDTSRNKLRRWCSMRDCGNRAKARRHRARQREAPAEADAS